MAKYKAVHYINQFFAGIGGEEKADHLPEIREGIVGPGAGLKTALGNDFEIVATVICGDNYFGENLEAATKTVIDMVKKYNPQLFIAGPAFNAGRYGVACGTICKAVEEQLGIPSVTGMYVENPGTDMFRKDLIIVETPNSAAGMSKVLPVMAALGKKLVSGTEILGPKEEGYIERGIRVNYFAEERGSERAIKMLLKKLKGEPFETDLPMPKFDRVAPAAPVKDIRKAKIAIVTSGGIVPTGNPDHIESSNATKWGKYDISGMDKLSADKFTSIHGGYDRQFAIANPNVVVPLDALRELEKAGEFGELVNYFCSTTGTGTATASAAKFGKEIGQMFIDEHVDAVILVST
ncbi:glycine reductase [Treponema pedis]|uniref:Sarcosine reductase complex component B subunitalpha n=4 Tax=Treponema pedis TaxID=409322 RepID=S6A2H8_9SPIR|nr:sarcosine reductase complex component B subunitalpha [Treponema pedis str. T A4]